MSDRPPQHTRIPPHNLDAERSALGAAMLDAAAAATVADQLTGDFYAPQHVAIHRAIAALVADDHPVDVVTVADELRRVGMLDELGGMSTLVELQNTLPSVSGLAHYVRIVKDAADRRRMIAAGAALVDAGFTETVDIGEALTGAQSNAQLIAARRAAGDELWSTSQIEWLDADAILADGLEPDEPVMLTRTDGAGLLYAGRLHVLQAEPSSGKGWIAITAGLQVVELGGIVWYIDLEDTGRNIMRRCQEAGATIDRDFLTRFRHLSFPAKLGAVELGELTARAGDAPPDLVIIDSVAEAMSRQGLDEDAANDCITWANLLPRPLAAQTGCAVLLIDHVVKDPEKRGRYGRGSGAKLGMVDVAYNVKVRAPFSRTRAGHTDLVIDKDREGAVGAPNETAATVKITPHAAGSRVVVVVDPYTAEMVKTDTWRPTMLMEKVSRAVEESVTPMPATTVRALVHTENPKLLKEALARLLAEGFLVEQGRPKTLRSVRPFRHAWEHGPGADGSPPPLDDDPTTTPTRLFAVPPPDDAEHRAAMDYLSRTPDHEGEHPQ